ncbi:hypothetical protein ANN_15446 [Periplaneta americana]|uniref:PiggyBac transposable element-derived protein domain-containing protein n=1 Tax=Periplaneta americana TaxID=6978 RepID=A0ABQ8SH32_PERAM|nr:hypothetical protein ANN_15446 [Periplaneta americana]
MQYDEDSKLLICRWNDNSVVTVVSNCNSVLPVSNVQRYSGSEKKNVAISQPAAITNYNINMGGTDLMNHNVSTYRKKYTSQEVVMVFLFVGVRCRCAKRIASLYERHGFRRSIAMGYQRQYGTPKSRPSLTVTPVSSRVTPSVRFDERGHIIVTQQKRTRCAVCKSQRTKR